MDNTFTKNLQIFLKFRPRNIKGFIKMFCNQFNLVHDNKRNPQTTFNKKQVTILHFYKFYLT